MAPPVPSIRWEMLREGIEDYEFLWLLRDLFNERRSELTERERAAYEKLLTVPDSITTSMTEFTTDSAPIYQHRRQIAEAIERLQRPD